MSLIWRLFISQVISICGRTSLFRSIWSNPLGSALCSAFGFCYYCFLLPHCFLPFAMLKREKYLPAMARTGWFLEIYFVVGVSAVQLAKVLFPAPRAAKAAPPAEKKAQ